MATNDKAPKSSGWLEWLWNAKTLLTMIALGEGASLIYASIVLDGHEGQYWNPLFWLSVLRGFMGLATSLAGAYSANELPKRPNTNKLSKRWGWISLGLLIFAGVLVMSVCAYGPPEGPFKVAAAIGFSMMPGMAALAISFSAGHVFQDEQPAPKPLQVAPAAGQSAQATAPAANQATGATTQAGQQPAPSGQNQTQASGQPAQAVAPAAAQQPVAPAACIHGCGKSGKEGWSQGWQNGHNQYCTHNTKGKSFDPAAVAATAP